MLVGTCCVAVVWQKKYGNKKHRLTNLSIPHMCMCNQTTSELSSTDSFAHYGWKSHTFSWFLTKKDRAFNDVQIRYTNVK